MKTSCVFVAIPIIIFSGCAVENREPDQNSSIDAYVGRPGTKERFEVLGSHLYSIATGYLWISDLDNPGGAKHLQSVDAHGNTFETLSLRDGWLWTGYPNGMGMHDLSDPVNPRPSHMTPIWGFRDPATVKDSILYLGPYAWDSTGPGVVKSIDMRDSAVKMLKADYSTSDPRSLTVVGDRLFLCDGQAGLKIYRIGEGVLTLLERVDGIDAERMALGPGSTVLVGSDRALYQFDYSQSPIKPLGVMTLQTSP